MQRTDSVATGDCPVQEKSWMIHPGFEKIVAEIAPETTIQVADVDKMGDRPICNSPIVIAEDSILLSKMIDDSLERAGFTNVKNFPMARRHGITFHKYIMILICMIRSIWSLQISKCRKWMAIGLQS